MSHEQTLHDQSCFLTLTYDDEHLPAFGQLVKRDLQLFFKRLRKQCGKFRYVACGEYGELRRRPHFHVALFGMDFRADRLLYGQGVKGDELYVSPTLSRVWSDGGHKIGCLTFESAAYIARYITKRLSGPNVCARPLACNPDTGEFVMPEPEFLLCSRRPGIGAGWFRDFFMTDVFPHGRVITSQGTPAPVPVFYKRLLKEQGADLSLELQHRTYAHFSANVDRDRLENSVARRAARSRYSEARTGVFKRDVKD